MSHFFIQLNHAQPLALGHQLDRLVVWDQLIIESVNEKSRAAHHRHFVYVPKSVLDQEFQEKANQALDHIPERCVGAHQDQATCVDKLCTIIFT